MKTINQNVRDGNLMDSKKSLKWGHPETDQGGEIDALLLDGLTEDQIIEAFSDKYPQHKNPRTRVKSHLKHLSDVHNVDLGLYLGLETISDDRLS